MSLPALIDIETFFADAEFSGASISPDGTRLAYLAPQHGRTQLWVRGVDEDHDVALCVTHDARRGVKKYHWTDDPRWMLYLQDTDGNEDWHLFRVDLENPLTPAVDLTPMPPGGRVVVVERTSQPGVVRVSMNPRIVYVDTFLITVATGETSTLRENDDMAGGFFFGPSGETFYGQQGDDGSAEYYTVDEATDERRLVRRYPGADYPLGLYPSQVTPDGKGLLLGTYHEGDDLALVRLDVETGEETVVAAVEGRDLCTAHHAVEAMPSTLILSERTGEVLAARFVGDRPLIKVVDPEFAAVYAKLSTLSDGVLADLSSDRSQQVWVATFAHDREPGQTYLYNHATGESRLLFSAYSDLDREALAPMTAVRITARDGLPLHTFLTLPVGIEPSGLPLVLLVHGGPWWHDQWGYDREVQLLANRGYAVLQVNFRGSTGYGKRHITAAIGQFAGTMHDDLVDAADWAVKQGYADPSRIGIYGCSYGGYAALVGVTFTPDFFAAAVDYCGISSLPDFMLSLPAFVREVLRNNWLTYVGNPEDPAQKADMLARSPITKVDEIRTPLLVVQGANDARVVQAEADNIVAKLRERGVPVEYLLAEDEGHGFQNPENLVLLFKTIERHFAEHLGGRSTERDAG